MDKETHMTFSEMEKLKEEVQHFVLFDDTFFAVAAEDAGFCEELIRTLLKDDTLEVIENKTQYSLRQMLTHSVQLDALVRDSRNKLYLVEIQRADDDNHIKRVRYNQASVDTSMLEKGHKYDELPEVISIFISKFDIFKGNRTVYHVDRIIRETEEIADNGTAEIYVNSEVDDHSVVAELMREFNNPDMDNPKFRKISKRVHYLKNEEGGREIMCERMQRIVNEGIDNVHCEDAIRMLKKGASVEMVSDYLAMPLDVVEKIQKELLASA